MGTGTAGALVVVVMALVSAPDVFAAGTCVYDAPTQTVTGAADPATPGVAVLTVGNTGALSFDGTACGVATTANTTAMNVDGAGRAVIANLSSAVTTTLITATDTSLVAIQDFAAGDVDWASGVLPDHRRAADLDDDGVAEVVTTAGALNLDGGSGNDTLSGAGGFATPGGDTVGPNTGHGAGLTGGSGGDTITGPGEIRPGPGNDTLVAGTSGLTTLRYLDGSPTTGVRMKPDLSGTETGFDAYGGTDTYSGFNGPTGDLNVVGSNQDDILYGGPRANDMQAADGDDQVFGLGGDDAVRGGSGGDHLEGGEGDDIVAATQPGLAGPDAGNVLRGGPGSDNYYGSETADDFGPVLDNEVDTVHCAGGYDTGRADARDALTDCEFPLPPELTLGPAPAAVDEGGTVQLTLTLSEVLPFAAEVDVLTLPGTASSGSDFMPVARRVTIPAGQTTATVDVSALADDEDEPSQTLTLALANPSPAPAPGPNATVTIIDKSTPVTTVVVGPDPGTGTGGTYLAPPNVAVTAPPPATEVRCVLDPATTPAAFADIPAGPCVYFGAGQKVTADGTHTLCAASTSTETGDTSAVACSTWSTDATPPSVSCGAAPSFNVGDTGKAVTASVADASSGPVATSLSAPADTTTSGEKTATLVGQDKAGNTSTVRCTYSVSSVALCGQPLVLFNVQLAGRKVALGGLAAAGYAGQTVTIKASGKRVGRAKIAPDGSFALRVKAPKASKRSRTKYQATLPDGSSTRQLRLQRSLVITKRRGNTVYGKVVASKAKRPKRVVFYRQSTCTTARVFKRVKVSRSGTFKLRLARPVAPESIALYRVKAALGKGTTYTVPIVVRGA